MTNHNSRENKESFLNDKDSAADEKSNNLQKSLSQKIWADILLGDIKKIEENEFERKTLIDDSK